MSDGKQSKSFRANCRLLYDALGNQEIFKLVFAWGGMQENIPAPRAGQFFMIKPKRSAVFLARPISLAMWEPNKVAFLIARRGKGTRELAVMQKGDEAELTGPLGNAWCKFLPDSAKTFGKPIALVGGGIGIAPLNALLAERLEYRFDFYAGFRTGFKNKKEEDDLLGEVYPGAENVIIATEDGKAGQKGRVTDFLEAEKYAAVCACGPEPMLKTVAAKCKAAEVPCFISMEKRMACGVGACLGCTVQTINGNRRCCADGPIFKADEVIFSE